ncbi:MAG: hypothetical protein ABIU54_02060 [Candidatus Eisenbacteria bacterium]
MIVVTAPLVLALCLSSSPAPAADSDPKAVKVAQQVLKALGGRERWDALKGLNWSFGSSVGDTVRSTRRHHWDKHTGAHRVEGVNRAGQKFVFIHTLGDTTQGLAWFDGVAVAPDSARKLAQRANLLWVNDSYWFLMPYKLLDPGVNLKYDGEVTEGGKRFEKLDMTFGAVGLTPGDHYWVFVNAKSHRVERWEFILQNQPPPPNRSSWEGWEEHGGLWFPTSHREERTNVFTNTIETVREFPAGTFTAP